MSKLLSGHSVMSSRALACLHSPKSRSQCIFFQFGTVPALWHLLLVNYILLSESKAPSL